MSEQQPFSPHEHLIQISKKDYLPVCWRLVWFRERFPQGSVETEMLHLDLDRDTEEEIVAWNPDKRRSEKVIKQAKGFVIFKATVKDGLGGVATGTKSENAASFGDYIEKAETGSIGRALAALGYGTQYVGDDFDEAHRIVDSPIEREPAGQQTPAPAAERTTASAGITAQQRAAITKLCQQISRTVPTDLGNMDYISAQAVIKQLTADYRTQKAS